MSLIFISQKSVSKLTLRIIVPCQNRQIVNSEMVLKVNFPVQENRCSYLDGETERILMFLFNKWHRASCSLHASGHLSGENEALNMQANLKIAFQLK